MANFFYPFFLPAAPKPPPRIYPHKGIAFTCSLNCITSGTGKRGPTHPDRSSNRVIYSISCECFYRKLLQGHGSVANILPSVFRYPFASPDTLLYQGFSPLSHNLCKSKKKLTNSSDDLPVESLIFQSIF